jgi:hypothetical protein
MSATWQPKEFATIDTAPRQRRRTSSPRTSAAPPTPRARDGRSLRPQPGRSGTITCRRAARTLASGMKYRPETPSPWSSSTGSPSPASRTRIRSPSTSTKPDRTTSRTAYGSPSAKRAERPGIGPIAMTNRGRARRGNRACLVEAEALMEGGISPTCHTESDHGRSRFAGRSPSSEGCDKDVVQPAQKVCPGDAGGGAGSQSAALGRGAIYASRYRSSSEGGLVADNANSSSQPGTPVLLVVDETELALGVSSVRGASPTRTTVGLTRSARP